MAPKPIAEYPPGSIVFAKLRGYPWWPARVSSCLYKGVVCGGRRTTTMPSKVNDTTVKYIKVVFGSFLRLGVWRLQLLCKKLTVSASCFQVEDDAKLPSKVLNQKGKTKGPMWTVFFFGSKD